VFWRSLSFRCFAAVPTNQRTQQTNEPTKHTQAFPTAYGLSKFFSGMLGAAFSPRLMLAGGVAITAAINLVFGATSSVPLWAALWAVNGALQGAGAPACAMLLSRWYPPRERGTYWGAWNAGSNLGGFLAPLLVGGVAAAFGWRAGFFVPGVWGLGAGAALLWALADDPVRLGFAPPDPQESARAEAAAERDERAHGAAVEAARQARTRRRADDAAAADAAAMAATGADAGAPAPAAAGSKPEATTFTAARAGAGGGGGATSDSGTESSQDEAEETPQERQRRGKRAALAASFSEVTRSRGIWLLAIAYFFVYVVRQGATSWLVFYLIEEKGVAGAAEAAARVSGLELGGLLGGTLAGVASDRAIRAAKARQHAAGGGAGGGEEGDGNDEEEEGLVGKRVRVAMAYAAAGVLALAALRALPPGSPPIVLWLAIACLGFCIYGPQMLLGLCGAELVTPAAVGASQGVLGLVSYAGAANAGAPLAHLQGLLGWDGYFLAMAGASVMALLLLAPLADAKSRVQVDRLFARRLPPLK